MRLFLSSMGLGRSPEALVTLVRDRRAAVITNALDNFTAARAKWESSQCAELNDLGFETQGLDLRAYFGRPKALAELLGRLDLVWATGGNSFLLRRAMAQSGFDELLRDALARDALVYGGFSAGTVVCAPSLRGLETIDDPVDAPEPYNPETPWEGLSLLPFSVVVHFDSDHPESPLAQEQAEKYAAQGQPFRTLRDGEVMIVQGDPDAARILSTNRQ